MKKYPIDKKEGDLRFTVDREVVSHLSIGLYRNFARAIKELISNSYDAGAKEIKIKLDIGKSEIIVRDNGRGMDIKEIENKFLNIGYVTKSSDIKDELGRKRIGTFGIGCLSVFPYCNKILLITKKRNINDIIELTINTEPFFSGIPLDIEKEKVPYKIHKSDIAKEKGETIIFLQGIKPYLAKELKQEKSKGRSSIDKYSGYQKFKWTLSQYSPLQFSPDSKELKNFFQVSKRIPMKIWLDGEELFRNTPENAKILEKGEERFGKVYLKYAIMTSMKPIEPEEARGLQVRLRDVAIGLPTDFEVSKLTGKVPGKLNYLAGEVHILEGLDNALMIDRDSFSYTQEVAEMQEFFRKKLIKWNYKLERWALKDKSIYESLRELPGSENIEKELKSKKIVQFSKERLRISKKPIIKRKIVAVNPLSVKIKEALSKKGDYTVISKKGKLSKNESPIEINTKKKSITIYQEHPIFQETIKIENKVFNISYDKWNYKKTPYSICRFDRENNKVIFNLTHPLFKTKLSDEIIKKLSLGFLIIVDKSKDKEELISRFNHLLEDVFNA